MTFVTDHMIHDLQHLMATVLVLLVVLFLLGLPLYRRYSNWFASAFHQSHSILTPLVETSRTTDSNLGAPMEKPDVSVHDTIFILPDISNYTRFIASEHVTESRAQETIFSLMNAMIIAGTKTVELSKLEGDAVLFYTNANQKTDLEIGKTVMAIFDAFFEERRRLIESDFCSCGSCRHVSNLDLKIFIHRGQSKRFNFRGSIDHFGADVTILHKLMKNNIRADRYVMVTAAADDNVKLPGDFVQHQVEEDLEHVGKIVATVYSFGDRLTEPALTDCTSQSNVLNRQNDESPTNVSGHC